MDNEHDSNQSVDNPANATPSIEPPKVDTAPAAQIETEQRLANTETNIEQRMSAFERASLRWTIAMFFVTLATGAFIALQWNEMHSGSADTHTLAEAAKSQAENTTKQLPIFQKQATAAQDSVNTVERQMRIDQRAWVGTQGYNIRFQQGEISPVVAFVVPVINTGKTPALNVTAEYTADTTHKPENINEFMQVHVNADIEASHGIIMPGNRILLTSPKPIPLHPDSVKAIEQGTKYLYLFGTIRYHDVFGYDHITHFCGLYGKDGPEDCPKGNWTDKILE